MVNVKSPQKLVDVLKPTKSSPGSPSPKGSPRSPRIRTEQQRESQVLIENFFREQNIKLEKGECTLSQPLLQTKVLPGIYNF